MKFVDLNDLYVINYEIIIWAQMYLWRRLWTYPFSGIYEITIY
ncbi:hypothetical protein [Winogradskyella sp.]